MTSEIDYIDSDQELNPHEQLIPERYTHIIKMLFDDDVHIRYVLPSEDVHTVESRMSTAGPILEVIHVETMIREQMQEFLSFHNLGQSHINRLIQAAISAHRNPA